VHGVGLERDIAEREKQDLVDWTRHQARR
jgi:hypothetical protein